MSMHFDEMIERRTSGSAKWNYYDEGVLPLWVADMDFRVAPAIIEALRQRVEHGIFGYALPPAALGEAICARLAERYSWAVTPEQLVYYPGVVISLNIAARAERPRRGPVDANAGLPADTERAPVLRASRAARSAGAK